MLVLRQTIGCLDKALARQIAWRSRPMLSATPFIRRRPGAAKARGRLFPPSPLIHFSFPYPTRLQSLELFLTINFRRRTGDGKANPTPQNLSVPLPRRTKEPQVLIGKAPAALLHPRGFAEEGKGSRALLDTPLQLRGQENLSYQAPAAKLPDAPESGLGELSRQNPVIMQVINRVAYSLIHPRRMTLGNQFHPVIMKPEKYGRTKISPLTISTPKSIGPVPPATEVLQSLSYRTRMETGSPRSDLDLHHQAESKAAARYLSGTSSTPFSSGAFCSGRARSGPLAPKETAHG